jgi:hypothetical protein
MAGEWRAGADGTETADGPPRRPGEATACPPPGWGAGCGLWRDATRSELRLLRQAIRQGWPIPQARRGPILADVFADLDSADSRRVIAVCRALLAADRANSGGR